MALRIGEESPIRSFLDGLEEYQPDGFEGRGGKSKSTVFLDDLEEYKLNDFEGR